MVAGLYFFPCAAVFIATRAWSQLNYANGIPADHVDQWLVARLLPSDVVLGRLTWIIPRAGTIVAQKK